MIKRAIIHILLIMIIVMDGLYSKNVRNAADFITEGNTIVIAAM